MEFEFSIAEKTSLCKPVIEVSEKDILIMEFKFRISNELLSREYVWTKNWMLSIPLIRMQVPR